MNYYWIVRSTAHGEALGIFMLKGYDPVQSHSIIKMLNNQIGHRKWAPIIITKAEFETYKEFGFTEYDVTL